MNSLQKGQLRKTCGPKWRCWSNTTDSLFLLIYNFFTRNDFVKQEMMGEKQHVVFNLWTRILSQQETLLSNLLQKPQMLKHWQIFSSSPTSCLLDGQNRLKTCFTRIFVIFSNKSVIPVVAEEQTTQMTFHLRFRKVPLLQEERLWKRDSL